MELGNPKDDSARPRYGQILTGDVQYGERSEHDFYRTPDHATRSLLRREAFDGSVWEPACGDGAISRVLGPATLSTDLQDYGFGETGVDFLRQTRVVDHIVTNPPYRLAQAFIEHALGLARKKIAMLLKLNFLEGQARYAFFDRTPLKMVYVFSERLSFDRGTGTDKGNGLLAYAWYVWDHAHRGAPLIGWIPPQKVARAGHRSDDLREVASRHLLVVRFARPAAPVALAPAMPRWSAVIREAMGQGPVTLADLYQRLAHHPKAQRNPHWREKVRQTLQRYDADCFRRVARGVWCAA